MLLSYRGLIRHTSLDKGIPGLGDTGIRIWMSLWEDVVFAEGREIDHYMVPKENVGDMPVNWCISNSGK